MNTINKVRQSFWDAHPQFKNEYRKTWRQNQYNTDIRCAFCDYIDRLQKDGIITGELSRRVTL